MNLIIRDRFIDIKNWEETIDIYDRVIDTRAQYRKRLIKTCESLGWKVVKLSCE